MYSSFTYQSQPQRVAFGAGSLARLPEELQQLGVHRALVLCTPHQREQAQQVADLVGGAQVVGLFDQAKMHVPVEVARAACELARQTRADCTIAVGGGSTIGLGKAIALDRGLPVIAVPTTYAGSEMTPIYGMTEGGLKKTGRDVRVLPRSVVYDPLLTGALPVALSVTSAINAIAHAAEGLYAIDGNPVMDLMAREGIRALAQAVPSLYAGQTEGTSLARRDALYGAWLCGAVLGGVGMALHHKLCHTLGGSFDLPHAEVHTIVLPHALAYNASAAPQAMASIAQALGVSHAAQGVYDLAHRHGAAVALRDIGMREQDLEKACDIALQTPYPNPRLLERAPLLQLLRNAYEGRRPQ